MKPKREMSKWTYWFSLAVAIILVYSCITNFAGICVFLKKIMNIIMPFLMAIIVAYLFYRPARFFEKIYENKKATSKISRPLSIFTVYLIAVLLIIIMINCVIPPIRTSIGDLIGDIPTFIDEAKEYLSTLEEDSLIKQLNIEETIKNISTIDFTSLLSANHLRYYINTVIGIVSTIFNVFITIVVSIYILMERGKIKKFLKQLGKAVFSEDVYDRISNYFSKSNWIFLDFIYCQIIDGIIVGILASIVMTVIGVEYAILLGFFIGIFNIIPYFGAIIAIAISAFITLFTGGFEQAIIMCIAVIILQQIDSNIINPKILGDGLKISPILVIFSITVGGEFFGILGMFLAVPIMAILKLVVTDFVEIRNRLKAYRKATMKINE